jgi:hypothetical protein
LKRKLKELDVVAQVVILATQETDAGESRV